MGRGEQRGEGEGELMWQARQDVELNSWSSGQGLENFTNLPFLKALLTTMGRSMSGSPPTALCRRHQQWPSPTTHITHWVMDRLGELGISSDFHKPVIGFVGS